MLDEFVQWSRDTDLANKYRKIAVKLLLSDIIAFGQPTLLDALDWFIRIMLCSVFVSCFGANVSKVVGTGCEMHSGGLSLSTGLFKNMLGCSGVHLWWALKGLS